MASTPTNRSSARQASLARRLALSSRGKGSALSAGSSPERTRTVTAAPASAPAPAAAPAPAQAAPARLQRPTRPGRPLRGLSLGSRAETAASGEPAAGVYSPARSASASRPAAARPGLGEPKGRALARARRAGLSQAGKRADRSSDRRRASDPRAVAKTAANGADTNDTKKNGCGCGCNGQRDATQDTAASQTQTQPPAAPSRPALRGAGLSLGKASLGQGRTRANGKTRPNGGALPNGAAKAAAGKPAGRLLSQARRSAQSGRGKAASGPASVASLARQANPRLSGRDLARQVRSQRSNGGSAGTPKGAPRPQGRVRPNGAAAGSTGALQGAQDQPWKVGASETARGSLVTGTRVGRSRSVTGDEPSTCRTVTGTEYLGAEIFRDFCRSEPTPAPAKVRTSSTGRGNRVTGNEVGRSTKVTGDEPGTCKQITGNEYLAPEQVEAFCGVRPTPPAAKVGKGVTTGGRPVSGTLVGKSGAGGGAGRVTGGEHGSGRQLTGSQYLNADEPAFAPGAAAQVPPKVGVTRTARGGAVTGTLVGPKGGAGGRVTGDEPGTCRRVTGDEYLGAEHFSAYCGTRPEPEPPKVGLSRTLKSLTVSGSLTGRSALVTGDEPGTCQAVTGTPYGGHEDAAAWCEPKSQRAIEARVPQRPATGGAPLTGLQPGVAGVATGDRRGACEPVTGTPYLGTDQLLEACTGALPGEPDFPRSLAEAALPVPGQGFSIAPPFGALRPNGGPNGALNAGPSGGASPLGTARANGRPNGAGSVTGPWAGSQASHSALAAGLGGSRVTGTRYGGTGGNGRITGPFDMGTGKVTGTELGGWTTRRSVMSPPPRANGAGQATGRATPAASPLPLPLELAADAAAAAAPEPGEALADPQAQRPRITGEGQTAGAKVTGDDWERGDRVTGTEGTSATRRNPTRAGPMSAMPAVEKKRNEEVPRPVSRVTGASGSTDRGALVTYSGGARG